MTIKVWRCRNPYHPQPCWHGRCDQCAEATAFDFSEEDARSLIENHIAEDHSHEPA